MNTLKSIIQSEIEKHNANGLCNPYLECGCGKDNLFPCEMPELDCELAVKKDGIFVPQSNGGTQNEN